MWIMTFFSGAVWKVCKGRAQEGRPQALPRANAAGPWGWGGWGAEDAGLCAKLSLLRQLVGSKIRSPGVGNWTFCAL